MKQTDRAFWLTVIPAVILWNSARPWALRLAFGDRAALLAATEDPALRMSANILLSGAIALVAGYLAGVIAQPWHLRAAANVAVGVAIAFGMQNVIEYRAAGHPVWYFFALPGISAGAALLGGGMRALRWRGQESG